MAKHFPNKIEPQAASALPAGHARREAQARQADQLEQQAEELAEATQTCGIDPEALTPDEELQAMLWRDGSEVTDAQPGYCYMWVSMRHATNALTMQAQGWATVKADDPESPEYRAPDGTRMRGDSMLMRIPERRKQLLDYRIAELNARREGKDAEQLKKLADQHGIKIVSFDEMDDEQRNTIQRRAARQFGRQAAAQKLRPEPTRRHRPRRSAGLLTGGHHGSHCTSEPSHRIHPLPTMRGEAVGSFRSPRASKRPPRVGRKAPC